jgi:hypothetical protein
VHDADPLTTPTADVAEWRAEREHAVLKGDGLELIQVVCQLVMATGATRPSPEAFKLRICLFFSGLVNWVLLGFTS